MEFVNSIAKIVHMEVSLHGGAPNKNIGDAFLLVWKMPKGYTSKDIPKPSEVFGQPRPERGSFKAWLDVPRTAIGERQSGGTPVAATAFGQPSLPPRVSRELIQGLRGNSGVLHQILGGIQDFQAWTCGVNQAWEVLP